MLGESGPIRKDLGSLHVLGLLRKCWKGQGWDYNVGYLEGGNLLQVRVQMGGPRPRRAARCLVARPSTRARGALSGCAARNQGARPATTPGGHHDRVGSLAFVGGWGGL